MTVRELIETLNNFPEAWKDNQVMCLHEHPPESTSPEEAAMVQEVGPGIYLGPIETLSRVSMTKVSRDRNLFHLPFDAIVID